MQQIADWLEKLGMSEYAQRFAENDIDISPAQTHPSRSAVQMPVGRHSPQPASASTRHNSPANLRSAALEDPDLGMRETTAEAIRKIGPAKAICSDPPPALPSVPPTT